MARLAILDLYNGSPNQGMRCIQEIVAAFGDRIEYDVFDVRGKAEIPGLDYDIYVSSGGPGDPREGDGHWDEKYYQWLDAIWEWNQKTEEKKYAFFICHSFQMVVNHFNVAEIKERQSMSFGTFPVHKTAEGRKEPVFQGLDDPFWVADFRNYQAVNLNEEAMDEMGATVLALEKIRPHVDLERAIMGIRFSPEIIAVQFHPEADPKGMIAHFIDMDRRQAIIDEHGADKYHRMLADLRHPDRIMRTYNKILPQFLKEAIEATNLMLA